MKNSPIKIIFSFLIFIFLVSNCSKYNKGQISNIEKLSTPDKHYDLYLYTIDSDMAFGSAVNALKIVQYNEEPEFYDSEFLRISNSRPFQIKWDNKNLIIKTISQNSGVSETQPVRTELQNYKGVNIRNEVYTQFSGTAISEFKFASFYEMNGNLIFKNEKDSLVFNGTYSQISLDSNYIEINTFEQNVYIKGKGLAFDAYKLIPKNTFDFGKLTTYQPLQKVIIKTNDTR